MLFFFFSNLSTTISQYSAGGVTAPHQLFYNFLHDRPFQTSLFASQETGQSVGFSYNPFAYLHINAIHVYFSAFLFAPIWGLWPNLSWLYGLVIVVNYCGMALFAWKTLNHLSPKSAAIKTAFALSMLLASGFLFTFQQNAQLLLFSGPFLLAAYYFLLTRRKSIFLASIALVCLVSEDAAMVALTFSAYIYFFERDAKSFALASGIFSLTYLAIALFVLQPAARSHLVLSEANTTMVVLKHILDFSPALLTARLIGFFPALFFIPAFGMAYVLFGKSNISWRQLLGLIFLAPLPHWGECAIVGASHHLMPVLVFMFIALVLTLGRIPDTLAASIVSAKQKGAALLCLATIFMAGSFRTLISNLPDQLLLPAYKLAGMAGKANRIEQNLVEQQSNRRVLKAIEKLPKTSSLVYLTNSSIEGFIAGRSDIWAFPDYYDLADYLVIQPNAHQAFFSLDTNTHQNIAQAIKNGKRVDAGATITRELAQSITKLLVEETRTHRVIEDDSAVTILERIQKNPIPNPPSTIGFGWKSNLFHAKTATLE